MESKFAVEICVRGTTSTKNLWDASVGEELPCDMSATFGAPESGPVETGQAVLAATVLCATGWGCS